MNVLAVVAWLVILTFFIMGSMFLIVLGIGYIKDRESLLDIVVGLIIILGGASIVSIILLGALEVI